MLNDPAPSAVNPTVPDTAWKSAVVATAPVAVNIFQSRTTASGFSTFVAVTETE